MYNKEIFWNVRNFCHIDYLGFLSAPPRIDPILARSYPLLLKGCCQGWIHRRESRNVLDTAGGKEWRGSCGGGSSSATPNVHQSTMLCSVQCTHHCLVTQGIIRVKRPIWANHGSPSTCSHSTLLAHRQVFKVRAGPLLKAGEAWPKQSK